MGALTKCFKYLIVICNILLALIGVVLLSGGIVLMADSQNYIRDLLRNYYYIPPGEGNYSSGNGSTPAEPGSTGVDFTEFVRPIAIVLIVSGAIIAIIAMVGVCGICCNKPSLLVTFSVVVIVLIIAEIVLSILFFIKLFDDIIKTGVKETLVRNYVDIDDRGEYSIIWNALMIHHGCCGVDGYEDFNASLKWTRDRLPWLPPPPSETEELNVTLLLLSPLVTPIACCKYAGRIRDSGGRSYQGDLLRCATHPTNETSNLKRGCWKEIEKIFEPHRVTVIGIVCAIVVAQTVLVMIAVAVAWSLYKTSKEY